PRRGVRCLPYSCEPPTLPPPRPRKERNMDRHQSGLTLIEFSVAVAVVAVTSAIAFPPLQDLVQRQRGTSTMHRLVADMALARSRAVVTRQQVVVCPRAAELRCADHGDRNQGWLVFLDGDGNRQPDQATEVLRVADAPGGGTGLNVTSSRP